MRSLCRRHGAYAWIGLLALLLQMVSSAALAGRHSLHAGPIADAPPSLDAMANDHCATGAGPAAAGPDQTSAAHCPHCADRACGMPGCLAALFGVSPAPPPHGAVAEAYPVPVLSPACCAESLYRPPNRL